MIFSRFSSKIDPKHPAHASVTVPFTPDGDQGPAQTEPKGNEAKPAVQAPGTLDIAKSDGAQATVDAASEDKASGESMVSEGGHATPGKTRDAVREPDASTTGISEPSKGSADAAADKPALSA